MSVFPPRPRRRGSRPATLLRAGSLWESRRIGQILREETTSGALLLVAAFLALLWRNSQWGEGYQQLHDYAFGPAALDLRLSVADWCADALLAVFFFVAGLELKREFVAGDLSDPRRAALPVCAVLGGMSTPAVLYALANWGSVGKGWAIPTATDIAFALAVLAVINTHLPAALRTFLLALAVVDDLVSIVIIVVVFTGSLNWAALGAAALGVALFRFLLRRGVRSWWLLVPVAVLVWTAVHASGVHATAAGVALAFMVPVRKGEHGPCLAESLQHRLHPFSALVAVPLFAFFAAGVKIGGLRGFEAAFTDRVTLGVIAGLVVGKCAGVFGATWSLARFTRAELDPSLRWLDVFGVALLAGVGFTVPLLMGSLVFGAGSVEDGHVKIGVLTGAMTAALLAGVVLRLRNRAYRLLEEEEAEGTLGEDSG
ncbi:Na+/H+ antiporter NhaA [Segniliparus rugosus]|uniref:Na(+)/H(+) antiporter NhaA n=1 Tax=Segniliparus rugosus (strain ATCC BAA-974 / DSM 45345 / CCUG 50838 / CIP 108380 / JCM 13579 / CDC 945) TaxID=679197 RepID=E5XQ83_SEGRC|nr:Na+/H+ antiporter NhaA [Segniliparus rugosus]EFV13492.1 Na+/H+ antiporter NhaA [Segniliparus rugosus ATCC BAA-974]